MYMMWKKKKKETKKKTKSRKQFLLRTSRLINRSFPSNIITSIFTTKMTKYSYKNIEIANLHKPSNKFMSLPHNAG